MKNYPKPRVYAMIAVSGIFLMLMSACKKSDNDVVPDDPLRTTTVQLSGGNETPSVASTGTGTANIAFDKNKKTITYTVTWQLGASGSTTTDMHFHGAEDGSDLKSSPVVVPITGFSTGNSGTVSGTTRELSDVEVNQLLAGKWYVNVHSSVARPGELRGNIKFANP
jgi:hypothetical protein